MTEATDKGDVLARILAYKRHEAAAAKANASPSEMAQAARDAAPARGFRRALADAAARDGVALIAEIKKASPSRGLIRADFDPPALARAYGDGGATCLSVLTDHPSFQGSDADLAAARAACALPVLRKDFMIEPYQIAQSRVLGADAILLILAALEDAQAAELLAAAREFRMDALIEVHDADEMARAAALGGDLIGINNRNLRTFETRLETTLELAPLAPADALLVSESGIFTAEDVARAASSGAAAVLVGESLMRRADVAEATRRLLAR